MASLRCIETETYHVHDSPQGLTSRMAEDDGDSDCCNMGSPTAACAGSAPHTRVLGPANASHDIASLARHQAQHTRETRAGHVAYEVRGTTDGLRRYLLDSGCLQLLLLSPAEPQAQPHGDSSAGGTAQRPSGCWSTVEDEEAVGRVAVPLSVLAEAGADEGAAAVHTMQWALSARDLAQSLSYCLQQARAHQPIAHSSCTPFSEVQMPPNELWLVDDLLCLCAGVFPILNGLDHQIGEMRISMRSSVIADARLDGALPALKTPPKAEVHKFHGLMRDSIVDLQLRRAYRERDRSCACRGTVV
jgi:hypothetical protein